MLRIALVDDETEYITQMEQICRRFAAKNSCQLDIAAFTDGSRFLEKFIENRYSVVFIDIYMKDSNGIEIAKKLRTLDNTFLLVFLTHSGDFMPDAFSCHAFEYVTKPFTQERILQVLHDALSLVSPLPEYMEITSDRKTVQVMRQDICSIISDAHYLEIQLNDGRMLRSRMTISEFLELAGNDARFLSVNRGILLNIDYITHIEDKSCILEDGRKFSMRIRDSKNIEQTVQNYHFNKMRDLQHLKAGLSSG